MIEELYKNGPFVVSFDVDYGLMIYQKGIYHSIKSDDWMLNGEAKPEWRVVTHSVLLVGYGEENGLKFWIL